MKAIIFGFIFGLVLPFVGLFIGLQVSPVLADVMLFPISVASRLFDQPFGQLSDMARISLFVFSGVFWAFIFWIVSRMVGKRSG